MNIEHTITFETVTNQAIVDESGAIIVPESAYDSYVIRLYNLDAPNADGSPFIYQPINHLTDSKPFASQEEAEDWVTWYKSTYEPA